jgi:acyl dehydratase
MPIYYPDILEEGTQPRSFSYSDKDVMLYALGVGLGADPMDDRELAFVYEKGLKVVPTAATVLASTSGTRRAAEPLPQKPGHRQSSLNYLMLVHGEQKVELHKPLPASGEFSAASRTIGAFDKGESKGAVVLTETVWTDARGEKVATMTGSAFCRADGGFGGPRRDTPIPHAIPDRAPDIVCDLPTRPEMALIYRLSGDINPLHAEPQFAKDAGFPRPILHGLATFGVAGHAILKSVCGYDPTQLTAMAGRFSAPVFPGETIRTEMWKSGRVVSFRARVVERDIVAINNGRAEVKA